MHISKLATSILIILLLHCTVYSQELLTYDGLKVPADEINNKILIVTDMDYCSGCFSDIVNLLQSASLKPASVITILLVAKTDTAFIQQRLKMLRTYFPYADNYFYTIRVKEFSELRLYGHTIKKNPPLLIINSKKNFLTFDHTAILQKTNDIKEELIKFAMVTN